MDIIEKCQNLYDVASKEHRRVYKELKRIEERMEFLALLMTVVFTNGKAEVDADINLPVSDIKKIFMDIGIMEDGQILIMNKERETKVKTKFNISNLNDD